MIRYSVEKSILIYSDLETTFQTLHNFQTWPTWSPWLLIEPSCELHFAKDGKSYSWKGNVIGSGSISHTQQKKAEYLEMDLHFIKPWKSQAKIRFELLAEGEHTKVTWKMESALPLFLFWMKPMMTNMIGLDYERGLNMLKDLLEKQYVASKLTFQSNTQVDGCRYISIRTHCSFEELGPQMDKDLTTLQTFFAEQNLTPAGKPFSIYHRWNISRKLAEYSTAIPVEEIPTSLPNTFSQGERPTCTTYCVQHNGPYRHLANAWSAIMMHQRAKTFSASKAFEPFEIYENSPQETAENQLRTSVHIPSK